MIEPLLFLMLGMLVAALIWLLLLPAFWRRATRLARRALEQHLPLTPDEIAAERDRLRARFAVEMALSARREEKARADLVAARAETGERLSAEAELLAHLAARERLLADREVELAALRDRFRNLETELAELREARQLAETTIIGLQLQCDSLTARHNAALNLAEERRLHLEERGCEAENLRAALAEESRRAADLRHELQAREINLREAERHAATLENEMALLRIKRGEGMADVPVAARGASLRAG
jgi:chromosome segregation ATPase